MTAKLQALCNLLTEAEINFTIVSPHEISIESMSLIDTMRQPETATDEDVEADNEENPRFLWTRDTYLHIMEDNKGRFNLLAMVNDENDYDEEEG